MAGVKRLILFFFLFLLGAIGPLYFLEGQAQYISSQYAFSVFGDLMAGDISLVSNQEFVYTLASWIVAAGAGLIVAYLFTYGAIIPIQIRQATAIVRSAGNRRAFTDHYDELHERLSKHPLIGKAWLEFDETLVKPATDENGVIQNTVRPNVFMNAELVRGHSYGLKMMPSIPGYFVGIGLLLTFIGLVLALHKAGSAVTSEDSQAMQTATSELLSVASFKFATSIAGLGSSIVLGIVFRSIGIWIEGAFARLSQEIETVLLYRSPQSISVEMSSALHEQRDYLKDITQGDFFQRFGQEFEPRLQNAVSNAMAPVVSGIETAVGDLSNNSRQGTEDLIAKFSDSLHQGAGDEMRELSKTFENLQVSLSSMQEAMKQTSEGFGGDMEKASRTLNASLERAAATASERLGSALDGVVGDLETQIAVLARSLDATSSAMREQSSAQASALTNLKSLADAFDQSALNVQRASSPLLESSSKISTSVEKMERSIQESVSALEAEKQAASNLANTLSQQMEAQEALWKGYASRFEAIDVDLGKALGQLSDATREQGERMQDYALKVDQGLADAVDKLRTLLGGLDENTKEFGDSVDELSRTLSDRFDGQSVSAS